MKLVNSIALSLVAFSATAYANCSDIYISEYLEGSAYNKAIEIFNPTNHVIDLSDYQLELYSNGRALSADATLVEVLSGTLTTKDVYVLANPQASIEILDKTNTTSLTIRHNGDDAYILRKISTNEVVDSFGRVGEDPGSAWSDEEATTKDATLVKKEGVCGDSVVDDSFSPSTYFTSYEKDNISFLGAHLDAQQETNSSSSLTLLHTIQGESDVSALKGEKVNVEAVVVGVYPNLKGFFIQEEDADVDDNILTSEGLFVYCSASTCKDVALGDEVQISGAVSEYYNQTQLGSIDAFKIVSSHNTLPTPASLTMPFTSDLEAYEGMQVEVHASEGDLVLLQNYFLGQYGELSFGAKRLEQFTHSNLPNKEGYSAHLDSLTTNIITVDDGSTKRNPDPLFHELTPLTPFRAGSTTSVLKGCLSYGFKKYRIQPLEQLSLNDTNAREAIPKTVGGSLKVASFNVLNYFNTFSGCQGGVEGESMNCRGAKDAEEFQRQRTKIFDAMSKLDADIIGIMEIENDGYDANSAIADLVEGLNSYIGAKTYVYVDIDTLTSKPNAAGNDAIKVALVYKPAKVKLSEKSIAAALDNVDKNRVSVIQEFEDIKTKEKLVVSVNHLKSKGSACDAIEYVEGKDIDNKDGQANCNLTRLYGVKKLLSTLESNFDESSNIIILGDLNSYAKEDPIREIIAHGYSDLHSTFSEGLEYSYIFDSQVGYLDYALANSALASKITGFTTWPINADEAAALDYTTRYTSDNQDVLFYAPDAYRSSDHDPVIVGLNLEKPQPIHSLYIDAYLNARGKHRVELSWDTLTSKKVDIYRDGVRIKSKRNKGAFINRINAHSSANYTYKVCEHESDICTQNAFATFEAAKITLESNLLTSAKRKHRVELQWEGATYKVDVYRNGEKIKTTKNDGYFINKIKGKKKGTFNYKVCEKNTDICSNTATISF